MEREDPAITLQIRILGKEADILREACDAKAAENDQLANKVARLARKVRSLRIELKDRENKLADSEVTCQDLQAQLEFEKQRRLAAEKKLAECTREAEEAAESSREAQNELVGQLHAKKREFRTINDALKARLAEFKWLEESLAKEKKINERLRSAFETKEAQLARMEGLEGRVKTLGESADKLAQENQVLRENLAQAVACADLTLQKKVQNERISRQAFLSAGSKASQHLHRKLRRARVKLGNVLERLTGFQHR